MSPPPTDPNFRSPILMDDDAQYLGNSPGADGRGRLHVKVANQTSEAIPVVIVDTPAGGGEVYFNFDGLSTPGVEQTLISTTVPADTTRRLDLAVMVSRFEGTFRIYADSELIGSGRTGPGQKASFAWDPKRPFLEAAVIELKFTQRQNSPPQNIEAYLMGIDTNT